MGRNGSRMGTVLVLKVGKNNWLYSFKPDKLNFQVRPGIFLTWL